MKPKLQRNDIVYPELSYKINGILFDVFKEMGFGYQEKYYGKALAVRLTEEGLKFKEQVSMPIQYHAEDIGRYIFDFLIEDRIILELKKGDYFRKENMEQVIGYLKASGLRLGLLANFTRNGVRIRRILNIN
ncbi:MAG: GxxExxY protein [bacterium]|nr:GxxExxY protein [bacterium]